MIPIVSITNSINAIISGLLAVRLLISYRKHPTNVLRYFLNFYFLFFLYWFLLALPGLLWSNSYTGAWIVTSSYALLYVALIVAVRIPFILLGKQWVGNSIAAGMGIAGLFVVGAQLFHPYPYIQEIAPPFIYWRGIVPAWMRIITGIISIIGAVGFAATFAYLGVKSRNNHIIFYRSVSLALGMIMMALASASVFFVAITSPFIGLSVASVLVITGLSIMAHGLLHEHRGVMSQVQDSKADTPTV